MKSITLTTAVALLIIGSASALQIKNSVKLASAQGITETAEVAYLNHLSTYGRTFANKNDYQMRLKIFTNDKKQVDLHNQFDAETKGYTKGMNQFSDWTRMEKDAILTLENNEPANATPMKVNVPMDLGDDLSWMGLYGAARNQQQCGSCWAFAAGSAIEGLSATTKNGGKPWGDYVSTQQLIDCNKGANACNGGDAGDAIRWSVENKGNTWDGKYPYEGKEGTCRQDSANNQVLATSAAWVGRYTTTEEFKALVTSGPNIARFQVTDSFFQYKTGVWKDACIDKSNHAMGAVGYGTDSNGIYWIVRNSWAATWGEAGYGRISDSVAPYGCGMRTYNWKFTA